MKVKTAFLALATVTALGATLCATAAHADNVYWSVGVAQPGVHVTVGNAPAPRPVYVPAPVVVAPQPVYYPAPVYYRPPVVVQPAPVVYTGWGPGYWHRHHGWREHERFERERFEHRGWDRR